MERIPATHQMRLISNQTLPFQDYFLDRLSIQGFDTPCINELKNRISRLQESGFKEKIQKAIVAHQRALNPFEQQRHNLSKRQKRLDKQKLQFQLRKNNFARQNQVSKQYLEVIRLFITMVQQFVIATGIYMFADHPAPFILPRGGSIKTAKLGQRLLPMGKMTLGGLGIILAIIILAFFCIRCKRANRRINQ